MNESQSEPRFGCLVLADGTAFEGELVGAELAGVAAVGELTCHTTSSGYHQLITDPATSGQLVTFTYPHIGNAGVHDADARSERVQCAGLVVRDLARRHSNFRADRSLGELLVADGIACIASVDTRRLTRHVATVGTTWAAFGTAPVADLQQAAIDAAGGA